MGQKTFAAAQKQQMREQAVGSGHTLASGSLSSVCQGVNGATFGKVMLFCGLNTPHAVKAADTKPLRGATSTCTLDASLRPFLFPYTHSHVHLLYSCPVSQACCSTNQKHDSK